MSPKSSEPSVGGNIMESLFMLGPDWICIVLLEGIITWSVGSLGTFITDCLCQARLARRSIFVIKLRTMVAALLATAKLFPKISNTETDNVIAFLAAAVIELCG